MKISILTLFPEMVIGALQYSIIGRAIKNNLLQIETINLRDFGLGNYKQVDDKPYGGGVGMIMRVDIIASALANSKFEIRNSKLKEKIILLDPKGKKYNQAIARRLSKYDHLILICGHYEGVDARVDKLVDEKISIGDYILTGGEIPAMVIVDSVTRLLPGVLSKPEAIKYESFSEMNSPQPSLAKRGSKSPSPERRGQGEVFLEYPQYTRPEIFQGLKVPKVLLSGDPKKIKKWQSNKI